MVIYFSYLKSSTIFMLFECSCDIIKSGFFFLVKVKSQCPEIVTVHSLPMLWGSKVYCLACEGKTNFKVQINSKLISKANMFFNTILNSKFCFLSACQDARCYQNQRSWVHSRFYLTNCFVMQNFFENRMQSSLRCKIENGPMPLT